MTDYRDIGERVTVPDMRRAVIVAAPALPHIPYVEAAHWTRWPKRDVTQAITLHATCGSETVHSAEDCARMFADKTLESPRSAHYVGDPDSIVSCVPSAYRAWHCGHTGGERTIGLEACGLLDVASDDFGCAS